MNYCINIQVQYVCDTYLVCYHCFHYVLITLMDYRVMISMEPFVFCKLISKTIINGKATWIYSFLGKSQAHDCSGVIDGR